VRSDQPQCCHRERHRSGTAPVTGDKASTGRPCAVLPPLLATCAVQVSLRTLWPALGQPCAQQQHQLLLFALPYTYDQTPAQGPLALKFRKPWASPCHRGTRRFAKFCSLLRPARASNYNLSTTVNQQRVWPGIVDRLSGHDFTIAARAPACVTNHFEHSANIIVRLGH